MALAIPLATAGNGAGCLPPCYENVHIDDRVYEMTATRDDHFDFAGKWSCMKCGLGGSSAINYAHASGAFGWARNCVVMHHSLVHAR
jgi:hypothetical protein